jgi:peptidoglycan/LPS O-acetylase OafA/YrhL
VSVSPALTPPPGNPRFAGVDALRGVAILMVVVCHTTQLPGTPTAGGWLSNALWAGVVLFFAISGFLLYRPYAAAHAGDHPVASVGRFWRRRALRILPAYWVALTVLSLWPGTRGMWDHWWQNYLLVQGYGVSTGTDGIGVGWSLCVEVSFYLLLPLLAFAARRLGWWLGWWRAELLVVAAFGLVGFVVLSVAVYVTPLTVWLANTLAVMSPYFAGGMLLAVLSVRAERPGRARAIGAWLARRAPLAWAVAIGLWALSGWAASHEELPRSLLVAAHLGGLALFATLLLAPVAFAARGAVGRVVAWRPLTLLGLVSYGVFLWHYQLAWWLGGGAPWQNGTGPHLVGDVDHVVVVLTLATLAGSVAIATVSYRFVELPFLRRKDPRPAAEDADAPAERAPA